MDFENFNGIRNVVGYIWTEPGVATSTLHWTRCEFGIIVFFLKNAILWYIIRQLNQLKWLYIVMSIYITTRG